jgi:hypothetical protein
MSSNVLLEEITFSKLLKGRKCISTNENKNSTYSEKELT